MHASRTQPEIHMQDLQTDQIIALHSAIIARDGGDNRIISEGNLHQLVFQANLIPETIQRAAAVFYSLVAYPAFREGNIRTAQELAARILAEGGYCIDVGDNPAIRHLADGILAFTTEPEDIGAWYLAHARKQP
jgi:hypothetical protein